MKKTTSLAMFFILCLLAGCLQTPNEVLERMENYSDGKKIEKSEKNYCSIEELRNAKMEDIDHLPDNLELPKQVDFSGIKGISNLTFK